MLDYFALFLVFFVVIIFFYGIIAIHDIPYEISVKRNHPHQDAIHVAGWVSLFTLHAIWPFLWIWATLFREDRGWGFEQRVEKLESQEDELEQKENALETDVAQLKNALTEMHQELKSLKAQLADKEA